MDSPVPGHVRVLVIGAGFGGLATAIKLDEAGEEGFVVVERGSDVGGTWRDNHYPGAACDVPSQLYSYSFAPNPGWTRSFSPQPEIQAAEPRAETQRAYNDALQRRMSRTVWSAGGCASWSWYLDSHGRNVTLWPGATAPDREEISA